MQIFFCILQNRISRTYFRVLYFKELLASALLIGRCSWPIRNKSKGIKLEYIPVGAKVLRSDTRISSNHCNSCLSNSFTINEFFPIFYGLSSRVKNLISGNILISIYSSIFTITWLGQISYIIYDILHIGV